MVDTDLENQGDAAQDENSSGNRSQRWRTRHREDTNNLQRTKIEPQEGQDRSSGADLLFGLGFGETLKSWPGIEVFCRHLGTRFETLLQPQFAVIWRIIGKEAPFSSVDGWCWCAAVLDAFGTGGDDDVSMAKAFQVLVRNGKVVGSEIGPQEMNQVLLAMFAVLCWMTMALNPIVVDPNVGGTAINASPFCLAAEASTRSYFSRDFRRPVSKMFYAYRDQTLVADGWALRDAMEQGDSRNNDAGAVPNIATDNSAKAGTDDALYVSSLEYSALFTIGRVRLKWVDALGAHLAFDRSKHTLSVFRYPSFCVANILRRKDVNVIKKITSKLLPSYYDDGTLRDTPELYREVLLSYRILFGQSPKSRNLAFRNLSHSPDGIAPGDLDPFLLKICTSQLKSGWPWNRRVTIPSALFPVSVLDFDSNLQERDTYSAEDDFPVFGRRLLKLQRYNLRQQPSKWKDLWRDRRNPLQWYTFWAVFWVGGLGIFLAMLQLFVGAAQLYYAIPQPSSSAS